MNKRNLLFIKKRPVIFSFYSLFILYVCGPPREYERGAEAAAASGTPVLVLHGADDDTIPADGPSLLAACQKENAPNIRAVLLPGETHTSLLHDAQGRCSEAVFAQIDAFYAAALADGAG